MKKVLYYDCFAGISGDMHLGAMVDVGVPEAYLRAELEKLNIDGFHLEVGPDKRKGISGTRVSVVVENPDNEKHRHLRHIEELIGASSLSKRVKEKSLAIFMKVAEAEAKVHGIDIQKVHFHEVGALDSIADIVGAAISQEYLDVDEIRCSAVELGSGFVMCAHGRMPVPAPATAEIMKGLPVKSAGVDKEATTPTGAAILAATVDRFGDLEGLLVKKTAYGIGQRDGDTPNVLRVYIAETDEETLEDVEVARALVLECNIDDMAPEAFTHLQEQLFGAGAAHVWLTPIVMKKSRPAHMLNVLCYPEQAGVMKDVIFRDSSSIGVREYAVSKYMLRREVVSVETAYGKVDVKCSYYRGKRVSAKPEFEQCRKLALENGLSLEEVQREVIRKI